MDSLITEMRNVVGILYTQNQSFELLDLKPQKPVQVELREYMFAFLVRDENGYAHTLYVSKGNFAIMIVHPEPKPILFELVEEVQEPISFPIHQSI